MVHQVSEYWGKGTGLAEHCAEGEASPNHALGRTHTEQSGQRPQSCTCEGPAPNPADRGGFQSSSAQAELNEWGFSLVSGKWENGS